MPPRPVRTGAIWRQLLAGEGRGAGSRQSVEVPKLAAGALSRGTRPLLVQLYNPSWSRYSKGIALAEQVVREEPGGRSLGINCWSA